MPDHSDRSLLFRMLFMSIIGVVLLAVVFLFVDVSDTLAIISTASIMWVLLSFGAQILVYLLKAWRWMAILAGEVRFSDLLWVQSIGFLVNGLIPIRLGEVTRAVILKQKERSRFFKIFSSIIVERLLDLLGLVILFLAVIMLPGSLSIVPSWMLGIIEIVAVLVLVGLAVLLVGTNRRDTTLDFINTVITATHLPKRLISRIMSFAESTIDGGRAVGVSFRRMMFALILTIVVWTTNMAAAYFLFLSVGYIAPLTVVAIGFVAVTLSFIIPAAPGHVGTFEVYWLTVFLALGLSHSEELLAVGVLNHIVGLSTTVVLGGIGLVWLGGSLRQILQYNKLTTT